MAEIRKPRPGKLFAALLVRGVERFSVAEQALEEKFGQIELRSADFPFPQTQYYLRTMGEALTKRLVAFQGSFDPERLAEAKVWSNAFESRHLDDVQRTINVDPGFLTEAKIVLASCKDNAHRIPIGQGIFAEPTMLFDAKTSAYAPLPWTYPDYAGSNVHAFFLELRERFRRELRKS